MSKKNQQQGSRGGSIGSEEVNVVKLLVSYLRYWHIFAVSFVVAIVLATLYINYATPEYLITSTLLLKDDDKGADFSRNAVYSDLENYKFSNNLDNEIEVIKSKSLMMSVLTDLSLFTSCYESDGLFRNKELYGYNLPVDIKIIEVKSDDFYKLKDVFVYLKDSSAFDLEMNGSRYSFDFGKPISAAGGVFSIHKNDEWTSMESIVSPRKLMISFHNPEVLVDQYAQKLMVEAVNIKASTININFKSNVPDKGKDVVNELISQYRQEAIEDKNAIAANTIQFIDERLEYLTAELSQVEKGVEDYKRRYDITDMSSESSQYLKNTSAYREQLRELATQIDVLESIENYLLKKPDEFEMVPSSLNIEDATLLSLITKYNDLQIERSRLLRTAQPSNPLIKNINEQSENLRANIIENLRNIKNSILISQRNLQASSNQNQSKVHQVPLIERELLEINRQQSIKQEHYLYLLKKREESALSLAATTFSNSRIIDGARASQKPVSPRKMVIFLAAAILGIGFPFVFVFGTIALNDKIGSKEDIASATDVAVLGEITHASKDEMKSILHKSRAPITEQFRLVRSNLFYAIGAQKKVLLITSSINAEGKTFFSLNLAASMCMAGKKVVVLEFDLRKPALLNSIGLTQTSGIADYLLDANLPLDSIIRDSELSPSLKVIGCGKTPENPAELMMSDKVAGLITELKTRFDYVIIDSAPVGLVADSYAFTGVVDAAIYLIKYNYTKKRYFETINEIQHHNKFGHLMLAVNNVAKTTSDGFGYGYESV